MNRFYIGLFRYQIQHHSHSHYYSRPKLNCLIKSEIDIQDVIIKMLSFVSLSVTIYIFFFLVTSFLTHLKCESITGEAGLIHCATHTLSAITIPIMRYVRAYFNLKQERKKTKTIGECASV